MKTFKSIRNVIKIITLFLVLGGLFYQANKTSNFGSFKEEFYKRYQDLDFPNVQLDYVSNLRNIGTKHQLEKQRLFFDQMKKQWIAIDSSKLNEAEYLDYQIIGYEIDLHEDRLALERKWDPKINLNNQKSIYSIPYGKDWYTYLLKRWVDKTVSPQELFEFGASEIQKVKTEMKKIQNTSGLSTKEFEEFLEDASFFIESPEDVQVAFEEIHLTVAKKVSHLFPYIDKIPQVSIRRGTNPALAHAPAYYDNNTFYYNLFDKPFNKRQVGWFYAHEAIPGHHYQGAVNELVNRSSIQDLFWYLGYVEGWGAYVEHLGKELGVYPTIYDEYGKWEWDLIRSVRVCMDIGINYKGWSDERAYAFWETHIQNKRDIATREIARMKRWPAQVITYKYGAAIFLSLLNEEKKDPEFNYKEFHQKMLHHGDIPMSILLQNWSRNNVKMS